MRYILTLLGLLIGGTAQAQWLGPIPAAPVGGVTDCFLAAALGQVPFSNGTGGCTASAATLDAGGDLASVLTLNGMNLITGATGTQIMGISAGANLVGGATGLGPTAFGLGTAGGGLNSASNRDVGMGGGTGLSGTEDSLFGFFAGTQITTAVWITGFGHEACSRVVDGSRLNCLGVDSLKYGLHDNDIVANGANTGKFVWNSQQVVANGSLALQGAGVSVAVTGTASLGGLVELAVTSTAGMTTGDAVFVGGVGGTIEANSSNNSAGAPAYYNNPWYINVIDGTHVTLQGSTWTHVWTAGGTIIDLPSGVSNQSIGTIINNGSGLIRVEVANTTNLATGDTVYVGNVTGTTEANGTWVITVVDSNCITAGSGKTCRVDLQGSTFTNAYVSGGQMTALVGPRYATAVGYNSIGSTSLTGQINNVAALGNNACLGCTSLSNALVIGPGVGATKLGSTGHNYNVILQGTSASTDVATATVQSAVGIGPDIALMDSSVQVGNAAGFHNNITGGTRNVLVGRSVGGLNLVAPTQLTALGDSVGAATCTSPVNVLLLGTDANTKCTGESEQNVIHVGAGGADILYATGTGTASTAAITVAGNWTFTNGTSPVIGTKTANYTVLTTDNGTHFVNTGASGEVDFALPAAAAGLNYCFTVDAAQTVKVVAATSEKIANGTSNSASAGNVTASAAFSSICIQAHKALQWEALSATGTWTVN